MTEGKDYRALFVDTYAQEILEYLRVNKALVTNVVKILSDDTLWEGLADEQKEELQTVADKLAGAREEFKVLSDSKALSKLVPDDASPQEARQIAENERMKHTHRVTNLLEAMQHIFEGKDFASNMEFYHNYEGFFRRLFKGDERIVIIETFLKIISQSPQELRAHGKAYNDEIENKLQMLEYDLRVMSDEDGQFENPPEAIKTDLIRRISAMISNLQDFE